MTSRRTKIAFVSSGLGNTVRGFETSTARWAHLLREHTDFDVKLYCGGETDGGTKLWNFPRNSTWTKPAAFIPFMSEQHRWEFTYGIEQFSFWSALNFELIAWKPDIIWVKDVPLAHLLIGSRVAFGLNYKIIFANGSKFKPRTYEHFDITQQIQRRCFDEAIEYGIPSSKMELLSNCFPSVAASADRAQTRQRLALAADDWVIICVAAWNRYHKRIDYLLREVAEIRDPKVKLILCGTPEVESKALQRLGAELLGDRVQWLTVSESEIPSILKASDVFVLPSLQEGLGNALIEAALCGLPVITHPHEGAQFSINDSYWFTDLSESGNLTSRLLDWRHQPPSNERVRQLQAEVSARFSPEAQARQFEAMVARVLEQPRRDAPAGPTPRETPCETSRTKTEPFSMSQK